MHEPAKKNVTMHISALGLKRCVGIQSLNGKFEILEKGRKELILYWPKQLCIKKISVNKQNGDDTGTGQLLFAQNDSVRQVTAHSQKKIGYGYLCHGRLAILPSPRCSWTFPSARLFRMFIKIRMVKMRRMRRRRTMNPASHTQRSSLCVSTMWRTFLDP